MRHTNGSSSRQFGGPRVTTTRLPTVSDVGEKEKDADSMDSSSSDSSKSQSLEADSGNKYGEGEREDVSSGRSGSNSELEEEFEKDEEISEDSENSGQQSEPMDLQKVLLQNREALARRGLQRLNQNGFSRGSRAPTRESGRVIVPQQPHTMEEKWNYYISGLDSQFFDPRSKEAAMQGSSERIKLGEVSYRGVKVNHENSSDVQFVFKSRWEAKALRGQPVTSYDQFRAAVGQFVRFAIVCRSIPLSTAWQAGQLFQAVIQQDLVDVFLSYFQLRCSASTVLSKAFHLRALCQYAERYFATISPDAGQKARSELMTDYLTGICAAEKSEGRKGTSVMRREEYRIEMGKLVPSKDFRRFARIAEARLEDIMLHGTDINSNERLLSKWCINFVGMLLFEGGGQRTQVYTQLQEPEDLSSAIRSWKAGLPVTLAALLEKRPRQVGYSKVRFKTDTARFFEFHLKTVNPAIRLATRPLPSHGDIDESDDLTPDSDIKPILLHSRTGHPYKCDQVRSTLRCFISSVDPEMQTVTPSVLRSSYATWNFKAYREGRLFKDLSEDQFLDKIAKVMNTSPEQLRSTYIACGAMDADYDKIMIELQRVFEQDD
jgi:hypothetical protein